MKEWISLGLAGGSSGGLGMAGQMDTLSQSVNANVENHLCTHLRLWHACVCSDVHILVFHYYLMSLTYPIHGRGGGSFWPHFSDIFSHFLTGTHTIQF